MEYQFAQPVIGNQNLNRMQEQKVVEEESQPTAEYGIEKMTKNNMPNNDFIQFGVESVKPFAKIIADVMQEKGIQCVTSFRDNSYESKPQIFVSVGQGRDSTNNGIFYAGVSVIDNGVKLQIQLDDKAIKTHALDKTNSKAVQRISTYSFASKTSNTEITPNLRHLLSALQEKGIISEQQLSALQGAKTVQNQKGTETMNQNHFNQNNQDFQRTAVGVSKQLRETAENNPAIGNLLNSAEQKAYQLVSDLNNNQVAQPDTIWINIKQRQGQYAFDRNGNPNYDVSLSVKDNGTSLYMNLDKTMQIYRTSIYPQNAPETPALTAIENVLQNGGYMKQVQQQQNAPQYQQNNTQNVQKNQQSYMISKKTDMSNGDTARIVNAMIPATEKLSTILQQNGLQTKPLIDVSNTQYPKIRLTEKVGQNDFVSLDLALSNKNGNYSLFQNTTGFSNGQFQQGVQLTPNLQRASGIIGDYRSPVNQELKNMINQAMVSPQMTNPQQSIPQQSPQQNINTPQYQNSNPPQQPKYYRIDDKTNALAKEDSFVHSGLKTLEQFAQTLGQEINRQPVQPQYATQNGNFGKSQLWIHLQRDENNPERYKASLAIKDGNTSS